MATFTRQSLIKLVELILALVIIIMLYAADDHHFKSMSITTNVISTGTAFGYLIVLAGLFIGAVMGTPVNPRVDLIYSIIGLVLFIVSGVLVFSYFHGLSNGPTAGIVRAVFYIIEGAIFIVDAFLTFRGES